MVLSLFSFGITWVLLAVVFYGLAQIVPGFHANYVQVVWGAGFKVGFVDAVLVKGAELAGLSTFNPLLFIVFYAVTFVLVLASNAPAHGFYITGVVGPLIIAAANTALVFAIELGREWYRRKEAA